jgi:hypothetical protein
MVNGRLFEFPTPLVKTKTFTRPTRVRSDARTPAFNLVTERNSVALVFPFQRTVLPLVVFVP